MCEAVNFPIFTNGTSKGFNYQETLRTPSDFHDLLDRPQQQDTTKYPVINQPLDKDDKVAQTNFLPFGSNSIQDLPNILINYHKNLSLKNLNLANELNTLTIPRLEELKRDLGQKIREIKGLNEDFKNDLREQIAMTGQRLYDYLEALNDVGKGNTRTSAQSAASGTSSASAAPNGNGNSSTNQTIRKFKRDPFTLKFKLDYQLKNQILQESYLQEAYINLQTTASDLEKIIIQEIQRSLSTYSSSIDAQIRISYQLIINDLCKDGFLSKPYYEEWNKFIDRDNNQTFLKDIKVGSAIPKSRKLSDINYPFKDNFLSKCIKTGYLNKKSKFLRNYNKFFYLLTASLLYEFSSDSLSNSNKKNYNQNQNQNQNGEYSSDVEDYGEGGDELQSDTGASLQLKNATPSASYNLSQCTLGQLENDKNKFTLFYNTKKKILETSNIESDFVDEIETQKIAFKSNDLKELLLWYNYLKQLLKFKTPFDRAIYIEKRYLKSINKKNKNGTAVGGSTGDFNGNSKSTFANHSNESSSTFLNPPATGNYNGSSGKNSQLQGIAPEIIISDSSFIEEQQLQQQQPTQIQMPPPLQSSASFFSVLSDEEVFMGGNRSPPLSQQYNYYNGSQDYFQHHKSPRSLASAYDSSPKLPHTMYNLPYQLQQPPQQQQQQHHHRRNDSSSSATNFLKRPMIRLTNSTSNIHEGSLKNKLNEININKHGRRNKFMENLFSTGSGGGGHSRKNSGSNSSSSSMQLAPPVSVMSGVPTREGGFDGDRLQNMHKSNSYSNINRQG